MNEEEIIQGICASGSKQSEALTHLYRYKGPEFKRYFKFKGVPESQCEDILQQVILKIFSNAESFKGGIGFSENSANAWMIKSGQLQTSQQLQTVSLIPTLPKRIENKRWKLIFVYQMVLRSFAHLSLIVRLF